MRLVNNTPHVVRLLTSELPGEPFVRALVLLKATYDFDQAGRLTPSTAPMPILSAPLTTPFGVLHGELFPRKRGADLCVLGSVRRTHPVRQVDVSARVGGHESRMRVSGDRVWIRGPDNALVPSEPEPFSMMPLAYTRAFGGSAPGEFGPVPYADNPDGRGYCLDEASAPGSPLPNIEPADGPFVSRWDDRPPVAGWGPYPMFWGLRATAGVALDDARQRIAKVRPELFNHAHPSLVAPAISPGDVVALEGVLDAPVRFAVPDEVARVEVANGATSLRARAVVDGVYVWLDQGKVVVTQRAIFRYVFRRGEARGATVAMTSSAHRAVA